MPDYEKIEELVESLKRYINTNYELIKLESIERSSVIGSTLISIILLGLIGGLFVFFISLGVGFYLSNLIGDNYSGFLIVAGFYLLIGLILLVVRKKMVENPIRDKIIKKALGDNKL